MSVTTLIMGLLLSCTAAKGSEDEKRPGVRGL